MVACFDADWKHEEFKPRPDSPLIWCPDNGRQRIAQFIDSTRHTLWLQNERYQDQVIIERLVRAVTRGVKVHILAKPPHSLKPDKLIEGVGGLRILQDVGAKIHTLKPLKLHAKMFLADGQRAIIGSINIAPGSFDSRRELAIETDQPEAVKRLEKVAQHDWDLSHPLDLSDAALLADLKKRDGLSPDKLVLYEDSEHWGYHHNGHHGKNHDKPQASTPPTRHEVESARRPASRSAARARPMLAALSCCLLPRCRGDLSRKTYRATAAPATLRPRSRSTPSTLPSATTRTTCCRSIAVGGRNPWAHWTCRSFWACAATRKPTSKALPAWASASTGSLRTRATAAARPMRADIASSPPSCCRASRRHCVRSACPTQVYCTTSRHPMH